MGTIHMIRVTKHIMTYHRIVHTPTILQVETMPRLKGPNATNVGKG